MDNIDEDLNCIEFYPHSLDPIPDDLRRETVCIIHQINRRGTPVADAKKQCTELIKKIETEIGVQHFVCEIVAAEFAECLRKLDLVPDAIGFIEERMQRIKTRDFGSLLTLARIYELSGDYSSAEQPRLESLELAQDSGNLIWKSLALVKQACIFWHLQKPLNTRENVKHCIQTLEGCNLSQCLPFDEFTHRVIDTYKTLAYLHRFIGNRSDSVEYNTQVLKIVEQDPNAVVHILKLETQISCDYSNLKPVRSSDSKLFAMKAYERITSMESNEQYMIHHSSTMVHAMSRIAHSLYRCDKKADSLTVREHLHAIAKKYLKESYPEFARISADTALLCGELEENDKQQYYTQEAESALLSCQDLLENDLRFHVRELSDAWKSLALLYSMKKQISEGERCFEEAFAINTRVYGVNHQRLGRLYESRAYFYRRCNKFTEAIEDFKKSSEIAGEFRPDDRSLSQKMKKQIALTLKLQKQHS